MARRGCQVHARHLGTEASARACCTASPQKANYTTSFAPKPRPQAGGEPSGSQRAPVPAAQPPAVPPCRGDRGASSTELPPGEAPICHVRRQTMRKRVSSAPQTGEDQVAASAICSLRFITLCFVPNFKTPPNQGSRPQHCFIFKLPQMRWTPLLSAPSTFCLLQPARCG